MVPDDEDECEALVGLGNNLGVPDGARHRKMSRKISHANIVFKL